MHLYKPPSSVRTCVIFKWLITSPVVPSTYWPMAYRCSDDTSMIGCESSSQENCRESERGNRILYAGNAQMHKRFYHWIYCILFHNIQMKCFPVGWITWGGGEPVATHLNEICWPGRTLCSTNVDVISGVISVNGNTHTSNWYCFWINIYIIIRQRHIRRPQRCRWMEMAKMRTHINQCK